MQDCIASQVFPAASMGETHASNGRPRTAAQGLRVARTAQRNGFTAVRKTNAIHAPISKSISQQLSGGLRGPFFYGRAVRASLPSPGNGESGARARPRRFGSCLAAAQPAHPCPVVQSVRRDSVSRRKRILSPSRTPSVATSCGKSLPQHEQFHGSSRGKQVGRPTGMN
jgi:hypothetical protein